MAKSPFKILMADDDSDDCLFVREALKQVGTGADFACVKNGRELLDYLLSKTGQDGRTDSDLPDLILLDLNMPQKSGFEALMEIKADPSLKAVPIAIYSTSDSERDIKRCCELGACAFITKPPSFDELIEILKTLSNCGFYT